jgi:hypothetical protein
MIALGIYDGMSEDDYHGAHDALSSSGARTLIERSPAQFRYLQTHRKDKDEYDFGHGAHKYVLGEGSEIVEVDAPTWQGGDAKRAKAAARAEGKIPLLTKQVVQAKEMARMVHAHPIAGKLFQQGKPEQSLFWQDEQTGVTLRARPDFMTWLGGRLYVPDYKTSRGSGPEDFSKSAGSYGYYMQHPFYTEGIRALGIADNPAFLFVTQSKEPPYFVDVCELAPDEVELGHLMNRKAIELFAECMASGEWPDYSHEIHRISLPTWVRYHAERVLNA